MSSQRVPLLRDAALVFFHHEGLFCAVCPVFQGWAVLSLRECLVFWTLRECFARACWILQISRHAVFARRSIYLFFCARRRMGSFLAVKNCVVANKKLTLLRKHLVDRKSQVPLTQKKVLLGWLQNASIG